MSFFRKIVWKTKVYACNIFWLECTLVIFQTCFWSHGERWDFYFEANTIFETFRRLEREMLEEGQATTRASGVEEPTRNTHTHTHTHWHISPNNLMASTFQLRSSLASRSAAGSSATLCSMIVRASPQC